MFILDSLMISGIRWALQTVATAAEAEMNDDGALREQLLEAEMRREMGELSDEEFRRTEASLLARIREIRERREGGSGPLGFTAPTSDEDAGRISVEASLTGDFHPPSPSATAGQVPPSPSATARPVPPFAEKPRRPVASARPVPPSRRRAASRAAVAEQPRQRKPRPDAHASGRARKRRA
jgi:hypothetical protein